jgi:hypothetical protein
MPSRFRHLPADHPHRRTDAFVSILNDIDTPLALKFHAHFMVHYKYDDFGSVEIEPDYLFSVLHQSAEEYAEQWAAHGGADIFQVVYLCLEVDSKVTYYIRPVAVEGVPIAFECYINKEPLLVNLVDQLYF